MKAQPDDERRLRVILFSGGRGSGVLSQGLINDPRIELTIAVNGYDDGLSTGEVRRFLGDCLGPSDFRKNASRMARALGTAPSALIDMLDLRLPKGTTADEAVRVLRDLSAAGDEGWAAQLRRLYEEAPPETADKVRERLKWFLDERERTGREFDFSDCAVGNVVFAGCFLAAGRDFNRCLADYCELFGLPHGLILNVTDGADLHLVALDDGNRVLATEEEIVAPDRRNYVRDIYLLSERLDGARAAAISRSPDPASELQKLHVAPRLNPELERRIAEADLIIYAPGTQHSSLFPTYLTNGVGEAVASNLGAIKLLITNIREDSEIPGRSALDLTEKALYYLRRKDALRIEAPCLVSHYLVNDPSTPESEEPYVPLGRIETLEDPRLVRLGNFEEGVSGKHDAEKILTPFLTSLAGQGRRRSVAVLLTGEDSVDKRAQTILEALRGGLEQVSCRVCFAYTGEDLSESFRRRLPCDARRLEGSSDAVKQYLREGGFDYVLLFESSGMYRGEDIVNLLSFVTSDRIDAVWGSRRLSTRDISESYRRRYAGSPVFGAVSRIGSHLLSLAYLAAFGRYVSDTLSGARLVRAEDLLAVPRIDAPDLNHRLLSRLLRRRGDLLETPAQFFPISPDRVKRPTVGQGLTAVLKVFWWRLFPPPESSLMPAAVSAPAAESRS